MQTYKKKFIHSALFIIVFAQLVSCGSSNSDSQNYEWELTFEDQFDKFDTTKWISFFDSGGRTNWANKEIQWYRDENVIADNGTLKLIAKKESVYGRDLQGEKQFEYTSGIICSSLGFLQAYGKWEIKVKFPFRKGFWPALWLVPKQDPTLPETDVFEYFGIKKNNISCGHHWGIEYPHYSGNVYEGEGAPFYYSDSKETKGNFSDVWMIWEFECFPSKMVWKLNDEVIYESAEGIPTSPLYIIANVAVKDWPENNYKADDSDLPYTMEIDYIKVYKMVPKKN